MILTDKRILVTGGEGFLGKYVVEELCRNGCLDICVPRHANYDLRDKRDVKILYMLNRPDVVIHCAAHVGGIGLNKAKPAELFYDNAVMGLHVMEGAREFGVEKFVQIGTICSYPKVVPVPFREEDLWNGFPEETNAPYGIAKRALIMMGLAYRKQYDFNAINLLPVNLYGPRDHFDLEKSHVIPAMIRKFVDAKKYGNKKVTLWGTGKATREFLFASDAAKAIVLAAERYNESEPVNIGTGSSVSIFDLAHMIAQKVGYEGSIVFDARMPDGQPERCLNVERAKRLFGFTASVSLSEGLDATIDWYRSNS